MSALTVTGAWPLKYTVHYSIFRPIHNRKPVMERLSRVHEFTRASTCLIIGRAIAQAVNRWLPTAAARVQTQVWSSGICGGQSGAGAGFLRVLRFPPANLNSTKFSTIIITRGRYNRPFSGRRAEWTQLGLHPPQCENTCLIRSKSPIDRILNCRLLPYGILHHAFWYKS
jgi:hypothetical protein